MELTGTIKVIGSTQQVSDKFKKRDIVVTEHSSQYPQHIQLQFSQDKCGILDKYDAGEEIKIHFNLRGREWTNPQGEVKYFNTLDAWRIERVAGGGQAQQEQDTKESFSVHENQDDLPF